MVSDKYNGDGIRYLSGALFVLVIYVEFNTTSINIILG